MKTENQIKLPFKEVICSHFEGGNARNLAEQYCGKNFHT
jgi:hypothetical protein